MPVCPGILPVARLSISMRYLFHFLLLLALAHPANSSPSEVHPFEKAVSTRLGSHPDLEAARWVIREAEFQARTAGRLSDPELTGELAGGPDAEGRLEAGLIQKFPLTARLKYERDLGNFAIEAAREEVRLREVELARDLRVTLHEWIEARAQSDLQRSRIKTAQQMFAGLESSAAGGQSSPIELAEAQIEIEGIQAELRRCEAIEAVALGAAELVWGGSVPVVPECPVPEWIPEKPPTGPQLRPDLVLARLALKSSRVGTSLAKAKGWEDIAVGLFFEGERFRSSSGGFEPESLAGVRLSIPLPLWRDSSAETAAKEAAAQNRQLQLRNAEARAAREAEAAWSTLAARHRAVRSYQEACQSATRHLETLWSAGPEIGRSQIFKQSVLIHSLQSEHLKARLDYHLACSAWLFATGLTQHPNP